MASIGHELGHALEVLGDPTVTTGHAMSSSTQDRNMGGGSAFETPAAVAAGDTVRAEIGNGGASTWAGLKPCAILNPVTCDWRIATGDCRLTSPGPQSLECLFIAEAPGRRDRT